MSFSSGTNILIQPQDGVAPVRALIDEARTKIRVKMFVFTAEALLDGLIAAHGRGVDVRVMLIRRALRAAGPTTRRRTASERQASLSRGPTRTTARRLARAFNQIALQSFGGGLSAWSREVIVQEYGWLSEEEYLSASAICRVLPGANQVNFAAFVRTRLRGVQGAVAYVLGLIAVPMVLVLLVGALYLRFRDLPGLQHFLSGMTAAAIGLTLATAWRQGRKVLGGGLLALLADWP